MFKKYFSLNLLIFLFLTIVIMCTLIIVGVSFNPLLAFIPGLGLVGNSFFIHLTKVHALIILRLSGLNIIILLLSLALGNPINWAAIIFAFTMAIASLILMKKAIS